VTSDDVEKRFLDELKWADGSRTRIARSILATRLGHQAKGVHFKTVEDGLDTRGSTGKLVLHMLGAVAQFERDLIVERTRAGLAAARKRGRNLGPPAKWQADMAPRARALLDRGDLKAEEVARMFKVSRRTLFRGLKAARDHDTMLAAKS
jgi:DNA invertase Pin-like site-specific DNA recombinase